MSDFYILDDDHNLIPADVLTWGRWFESGENRIVAQTQVGSLFISTVCLGIDHNFMRVGPAQLFETMIFRGGDGGDCWRCATWQEAEAQHARTVAALQQMLTASVTSIPAPMAGIEGKHEAVEVEVGESDDAD